uniref:Cation efflux protein cytoplasmic domain-containing protein n=1 Tax=Anopheles quadriannulatus TaxID=34691 RepID=A0A182X6X9_ANOQN
MAKFSGKKCRLLTVMTLTVFFFFVEIVVGYLTNSMALVADSFHMLGDIAALVISFLSIKMSPKKWSKNTFGWARAEVLGALVNAVFLVALCFSITIEACKRFIEVEHIHEPELLIAVGVIGLLVNLLGLCLLHKHGGGGHIGHSHGGGLSQAKQISGGSHGNLGNTDDNENKSFMYQQNGTVAKKTTHHGHSHDSSQMNMRGAFLHVLSDALGSVVVIISALIVKFTDWKYKLYMDPALSVLLVALILNSVWPLLRESALILLQTVPTHIQVDAIQRRLLEKVDGVLAVHEFHVWQLAGDRIIASAHIRCRNLSEYMKIAERVKEFFHNEGIHSTTIQPEFVEIEALNSYSGSDGFSNSLNGSATQDCCALDCPTTDESSCIKATCCQNNNNIKPVVVIDKGTAGDTKEPSGSSSAYEGDQPAGLMMAGGSSATDALLPGSGQNALESEDEAEE